MPKKRAVVTRATAVETSSAVVLRLDAQVGKRQVRGYGEATTRVSEHDTSTRAWRFLKAALGQVKGTRLSTERATVRRDVAGTMAKLRSLASSDGEAAYRGMLAGLDMALTDLAAKAAGIPLAALLGGERRPARPLRTTQRGKLTSLNAAMDAVADMSEVTAADVVPWLDLAGSLSLPDARKLIELLVERVQAGDFPPHLVVRNPVAPSEHGGLIDLQMAADAVIRPDDSLPGVVVMSDVWSANDARSLIDAGVRGIDLNIQRLGGTLSVVDVARDIRARSSVARMCLSTLPGGAGLAAHAASEVASATAMIDYVDAGRAGDVTVVAAAHAGDGPGLGVDVDLAPIANQMKRYISVPPRPPRPAMLGSQRENSFQLAPIKGFASYGWGIPLTSHLIERSALSRGLMTIRVWNGVVLVDHPQLSEPLGFANRRAGWTAVSAREVADDKELARTMLSAAGLPVPRGRSFAPSEVDAAVTYATSLAGPVVVKPRRGSHGIGVTTDLRDESDVRKAIVAVRETKFGHGDVIVEEYVSGAKYRFLVVGDRVASVVHSEPSSVSGDGESTVLELVLAKNLSRLQNPHLYTRLIELGMDASFWLDRQNLTMDSVPADGQVVRLGSAGNISSGGDSVEVLDETHPSLLKLAVQVTQAVPGLDHCGVDLIGDHRRAVGGQRLAVVEVNSAPGTLLNHYPMFGTPRDVSGELLLRSCELVGFEPDPPQSELMIQIKVFGRVQNVGYRAWFSRLAVARGLAGSIRNTGDGQVEILLAGPTDDVAALASRAFVGPRRATVTRVETKPVSQVQHADRFEVIS